MSRFYIKQIAASGKNVEYSAISFEDGVNIVYGPSNSGKSYIINSINFMFAGEIPFTKESTGYDTISMTMESDDGYAVSMERTIIDGKNGDAGCGTVNVVSNYPEVEDGEYSMSKLEYSDTLLKLMGIKEHHKIIATEDFAVQNMTIRQMLHLFFVDEDNIFGKGTVFDAPRYKKINASLCILNFLLTNDDSLKLLPDETKEERKKKTAQRAGVIMHLNQKFRNLQKKVRWNMRQLRA